MVQVTVYGLANATCTQRVLILLEELQLKYDFVSVDLSKKEHKKPEFLKLQPFGKVPVVQYGEKTLFESRSLLRYIAKNNRDKDTDLLGDVFSDIWLEVESQNFNPLISTIVYEKMFKEASPDETVVNKALANLEDVLDIYNQRLEHQNYIGGNSFTIADISHIPYAYAFLKCGNKDVIKKRIHVYNWFKRIMRRDAVRSVLEGRFGQ